MDLLVDLVLRWNARINLVAEADRQRIWERHILDSLQILALVPPATRSVLDIGTGAGFPGLVVALSSEIPTLLVEADLRKAAFLREAVRLTGANATVVAQRVEDVSAQVDLVTSRAVAKLTRLISWAKPRMTSDGYCLFQKGRTARDELAAAEGAWRMRAESFPSLVAPEAVILRLSRIEPR